MDSDTLNANIKGILSSYIDQRNNFHKQNVLALPTTGIAGNIRWDNMLNGYANALTEYLPTLNLAELEALSELINVRLNNIRKHMDNAKKGKR